MRKKDYEYNIAPKKAGLTGGQRKIRNKGVRDMCLLLNIICAIKRRKVSEVRPVARTGLKVLNFIRKTLRKIKSVKIMLQLVL